MSRYVSFTTKVKGIYYARPYFILYVVEKGNKKIFLPVTELICKTIISRQISTTTRRASEMSITYSYILLEKKKITQL